MHERVLCQETLWEGEGVKRVRQYLQGHHPKLGKLHQGWSGPETIVERDVIKAVGTFYVLPEPPTIPVDAPKYGASDWKQDLSVYRQSLWLSK